MATAVVERSASFYARIAGFIYLFAMALAIGNQAVLAGVVVPGDAATTAHNISASEGLFRLGIAADLVAFVCDVVMGWAMYELLKTVDKSLALLGAFFRVANAAILAVTAATALVILILLSGSDYLRVFDPNQLQGLAMVYLRARALGSYVGFVFLDLGASVFAYLLFRSRFIPRVLSAWGIFSSAIGVGGSLAVILFPWFTAKPAIASMTPMFFYEVSLGLWFLSKGVTVPTGPPLQAVDLR
jgi:hypothetical protein